VTGQAIIKIYLQPGADVSQAIAQTTAIAQSAIRSMPTGMVPPLIMQYSATAVPIMQIAMESDSLSEQQLFDYGINYIRSEIATIPGAQIPYPYGGKQRQIMVDIDPPRLHAVGLSPRDVQAALAVQNVVLPSTRSSSHRRPRRSRRSPVYRSRRTTAARCTSATSPTSATATRRRPTWSTSRAGGRC
jgi:multidrug efflux pump subunit AcrB